MPSLKKCSRLGLALALALASAVVAAPASADRPEGAGDAGQQKQAEHAEREQVKTEAEKPEKVERAEKAEKTEKAEKAEKAMTKRKDVIAKAPCAERTFARVFKPWNDRRLYTLAPGGDFETLADGWTLDGATVAADSSPFVLGAALGASSLELPAGATALSPPVCVERGFPSFRLVARTVSTEQAVVKVGVVYADGRVKKTGRLKPAADWAVTRKLSLAQGRFRVRRGESALVQVRFAVTAGTARLDDLYIDPRFWR
jgi:hypothetical protein